MRLDWLRYLVEVVNMAFAINPSIALGIQERDFGRGFDRMQDYQAKRLELDRLREQFNEEKEARLRQKQMQQGIASELQKMQQGTPAQYRTDFVQTMPTGQMPQGMTGVLARPQGMTGVLASERGQNLPTPDLFGENILKGNFDVRREMIAPEVKGVTPDYMDILNVSAKNALQVGDIDSFIKFSNAIKQERAAKAELDQPVGNPYPVYNQQGQAVGMRVMTKGGKEIAFGADGLTNVKPDVMTAYQKEQLQIERDKMAKAAELARLEREAKLNKPDPVTQALAIAQGKEDIKLAADQRAKVAEKYANASEIIPTLEKYITALSKTPETGLGELWEKGVSFTGIDKIAPFLGNKEQQAAMGEVKNLENILINYAQKQPGPSTDKDVQNYLEQVGAFRTATNLTQKLAAAKSALGYMRSIEKNFGGYASDILSGKVTPDELKARQDSVNTNNQAPDLSRLPTANIEKGSVAKDPKTGKPIAMFNGSNWIPWGGK